MPTASPDRRVRTREWVSWSLAASTLVLVAIQLVATSAAPTASRLAALCMATVFAGAGAALMTHQPENPVSWLVVLPAVYFAGGAAADLASVQLTGPAHLWALWVGQALFAATVFPLAALLPLLFPTGRPPSPRWRWAVPVGVLGVVLLTIGNATSPTLLHDLGVTGVTADARNPAAVVPVLVSEVALAVGLALFVVAFVTGVAAAVARSRRAEGIERQQLRWFARAGGGALVGWVGAIALEELGRQELSGLAFGAGLSLMPLGITVAVLRYRLYDLDRVVSRTLTWASVSGVLAVVYVGIVVGAQGVLGGREVPDVVVAGSTLLVAGLVRPLHGHLQVVVDRRFNRARVAAEQVVGDFALRLRDEVDHAAVEGALRGAVVGAVAPASAWVWTPPRDDTG